MSSILAPAPTQRLQQLHTEFNALSEEVVNLNQKALDLGHHILVFPQGTRSKRLLSGHTGIAQMTQRLNLDIVPIGCMGSEQSYNGNLPWAKAEPFDTTLANQSRQPVIKSAHYEFKTTSRPSVTMPKNSMAVGFEKLPTL